MFWCGSLCSNFIKKQPTVRLVLKCRQILLVDTWITTAHENTNLTVLYEYHYPGLSICDFAPSGLMNSTTAGSRNMTKTTTRSFSESDTQVSPNQLVLSVSDLENRGTALQKSFSRFLAGIQACREGWSNCTRQCAIRDLFVTGGSERVQRIASWLSLAKCKIENAIDKLNQQCSKLALLSYHNFNNYVSKQC